MSTQAILNFDARAEQQKNLERVKLSIGQPVEDFCRRRYLAGQPDFRMSELLSFVRERAAIAPASPDRILRQLRLEKVVEYEVTNRAKSLYRITGVR